MNIRMTEQVVMALPGNANLVVDLNFDLAGALFERQGDNLVIHSVTGEERRIADFFSAGDNVQVSFMLVDGSLVSGTELIDNYAENLSVTTEAQTENASSSGLHEYTGAAGILINGIDGLGTLDSGQWNSAGERISYSVAAVSTFEAARVFSPEKISGADNFLTPSGAIPGLGHSTDHGSAPADLGQLSGSNGLPPAGDYEQPPAAAPGVGSESSTEQTAGSGSGTPSPAGDAEQKTETGEQPPAVDPGSGNDSEPGPEQTTGPGNGSESDPEQATGSGSDTPPAIEPEQPSGSGDLPPATEPGSGPSPEPDVLSFDARAVLYAKNAVVGNDAYGVNIALLEKSGNGLTPVASGAPDSVRYVEGNGENYLACNIDAQSGSMTFSLTAAGLAAVTKAGAPDMEFYYTISKSGISYTVQVIITAKDVFNSNGYQNIFAQPTDGAAISEWYSGKTNLAKAYTASSGDNNDYLSFDSQLSGATVNSGAGNDHISVTAAAGKTVLDNNTTIILGTGSDVVTITAVNASPTSQATAMNKSVIDASLGNEGDIINITGTIRTSSISTGAGGDRITLAASVINGVAVDSSSSISMGGGDNNLSVTGRVISSKITSGDGDDVVSLRSDVSSASTPALASSEIDLGDGANKLSIAAVGNSATLYNLIAVSGSSIHGGDGGNEISINGAFKTSTLTTGNGNDAITISAVMNGSALLVDSSQISLGEGADTLSIKAERAPGVANVFAVSKSTIDARDGHEGDSISIEGQVRDSNILTGSGSDVLTFSGVSSTSATTPAYSGLQSTNRTTFYELNVGDGDNTVSVNYERDSASSSSRSVGMSGYDFRSGSGNDSLSITADYGVTNAYSTYSRAGEISLGAGDDSFTVNAQYGGINKVNLDMGSGNDSLNISLAQYAAPTATAYAAVENSVIRLGTGSDAMTINTSGVNTIALKNSTVEANADELGDKITVSGVVRDTNIHMGGGNDTLSFESTVNINTSATGAAAAAGLYSSDKGKHYTLDLGDGDNTLSIISHSTTNYETDGTGLLKGEIATVNLRSHAVEGYDIYSGSGDDSIHIKGDYGIYNGKDVSSGTKADSYTMLSTGAGDDTLTVESQFSAVYHAKIDMGDGNDHAVISSKSGVFALLHDAEINMGSGNDTLELNYANMLVTQDYASGGPFATYGKSTAGYFDGNKPDASINMGEGNDVLILRSHYESTDGYKDEIRLPYHTTHLDGGSNDAVSFDGMHSGDTVNVGDILGFGGKLADMVSSANLYDHDIKNFESLLVEVGEAGSPVNLDKLLSFVDRLEVGHANDIKSLVVTPGESGNLDKFTSNGHDMELSSSNITIKGLQGTFDAYTVESHNHEHIQVFLQVMNSTL